jgi:hypothetical protein
MAHQISTAEEGDTEETQVNSELECWKRGFRVAVFIENSTMNMLGLMSTKKEAGYIAFYRSALGRTRKRLFHVTRRT